MLSELHQVSRSLQNFRIVPAAVHPSVKPLSRGPFLLIDLNPNGTPAVLSVGTAERSATIPKIQKDNQNAFPTFKLKYPLFDVPPSAQIRPQLKSKGLSQSQRNELLQAGTRDAARLASSENRRRFMRMASFARELRSPLLREPYETPQLRALLDSIDAINPDRLLDESTAAIWAALNTGEDNYLLQAILIGDTNKRGEVEQREIPVVLDIHRQPGDETPRIGRAETFYLYSAALLTWGSQKLDGTCAVTGEPDELPGTLPSPRLPALADTILFSSNRDIPSLKRYGLTGSATFPVGKRTAHRLNDTALWMTTEERRGKTWSLVPRGDESRRDLLLTYVDLDPSLDGPLADLLASVDDTQAQGAFEAKAASVHEALAKLRARFATGGILRVLVLRRISKGQVQIELSREYDLEHLARAIRDWHAANQNIPWITLLTPSGKGKPARQLTARTLFPGMVVEVSKSQWIRQGHERIEVPGLSLGQTYDLFLGQAPESQKSATLLLRHMLKNTSRLLLLVGHQVSRHGPAVLDVPANARLEALGAATAVGIALHKLGREKKKYMSDTAFLLGRLLSLSDDLHKQYCMVVRDEQLPPQLLGNQHYSMAAERPARALALLGQRLKVYQAWANTAKPKREEQKIPINIAHWALSQMGSVTAALKGKLPERAFRDTEKAELLLGYLAREKKQEKEADE